MAVGSFLLVPILEELLFRGYVQTRLLEDFDAPTAILMTATFFSFSHGQYTLTLTPWTIGMLLTSLFEALVWGYVFYRTRSLIAPMVAHAIVNFPVRGIGDYLLPVAMLALVLIFRKQVIEEIRGFIAIYKSDSPSMFRRLLSIVCSALVAIAVSIALEPIMLLGIVILIMAIVLEFQEKRLVSQTQQLAPER
jgi:hypothetical protein